ncbi:LuxR C-terminal-related transcriptional regulator [Sphingobacterium sp. PCS056]|uniref:response regulator transcription factor n=1 Tax=Sphingobacterium sp. PCS056 TaxID=2931400 RepID=UPI00200F5C99|nr:LuxR C-terminal-related transcriptional regulator [Sphingobacterium sp. PCS056]UPZ35398.1 LuxR C-terminal-related transcriptional regulator [Sphingobacterium sp. PCS056]
MNNIAGILNEKLLKQVFDQEVDPSKQLEQYRYIAQFYAHIENAIAVLSDLKNNKSYIYAGGLAKTLGISDHNVEIDSIWEDAIFNLIHPDDLIKKHMLELQYFHFLKHVPLTERHNYHVISKIRMYNHENQYSWISHRMYYVRNSPNGSIWLALCLYNFAHFSENTEAYQGCIVNSVTGQIIQSENQESNNLLSKREIEILRLIKLGKRSKEIAHVLSISINTVNRHRQNILEKLRVTNSIAACRIASSLNLL